LAAPVQDQFNHFTYPGSSFGAGLGEPRDNASSTPTASPIHAIWETTTNLLADWIGGYTTIAAFRSPTIEFFVCQVPWLENDALYADMLLPVTTVFEDDIDLNVDVMGGTFFQLVLQNQAIEPIGESLSDYQICQKLAAALGVSSQLPTNGLSDQQVIQNAFNVSGVQNDITWTEFQAKQYYVVPTNPKWASLPRGFSEYYNASAGFGLNTKSGMIEFYCQWLADFNHTLPGGADTERGPVAHYIPYGPTHQESLVTARAQTYPLLAVTPHPHWRVHSEHEDISWLREIPTMKVRGSDGYQYECCWINPKDAASRGIKNGDVVEVFNERATVLGGAYVTERTMPGAIWMDHAARADPIADDIAVSFELDGLPVTNVGIDRGGSNNYLGPHTPLSTNASGLAANSYLVEVRKADLAALQAQYPAAFARPFDPAVGPIPMQTMVTTTSGSTGS
jgi:trimethylamine-N-oxide reductase (cytochrome c)